MQNSFDSANYPDAVPEKLNAGSRWAWTRSDITAAYPTIDYTLQFRFALLVSPYTSELVTASKIDGAHVVELPRAQTAVYAPGDYRWDAIIVRDSDAEEDVVDGGYANVMPDLGADPGETASWVYQVLVAIRATIKKTATREMRAYMVNGRQIEARSPEELLALEKEFAKRWRQEQDKVNKEAGRSSGSKVLVGMRA